MRLDREKFLEALSQAHVRAHRFLEAHPRKGAQQLRGNEEWAKSAGELADSLSVVSPGRPEPRPEPPGPAPQPGPGGATEAEIRQALALVHAFRRADAKGKPFAPRRTPRGFTVDWRERFTDTTGHHGDRSFDGELIAAAITALTAYADGRLRSEEGGRS